VPPSLPTPVLQQPSEKHIQGHSWFEKPAHIPRPDGKILRCEIREIIVSPCSIGVCVRYREHGKSRKANFSPIFIMSIHHMWVSQQVASDDEDVSASTIPVVSEILPRLRIMASEECKMNTEQKLAFGWTMKQTDALHALL